MSSEDQVETNDENAPAAAAGEEGSHTDDMPVDADADASRTSDVGPVSSAELDALRAERDALREERDKLKDQLLRTAADFDNYRKRARREVEEGKMRGKDDAVRDFLPVVDNLERAVQASESAQDVGSVVEGVRMVLKLFEDTAARMGLNRIKSVGERFDPTIHDALQQQETDAVEPGTILTEVAPGYQFGKRLLRAAMVIVARAPEKPESEAPPAASAPPDASAPPAASSEAPAASAPPAASSRPPTRSGAPPKSSKPPVRSSAPPEGASSRPPRASAPAPATSGDGEEQPE